ncbi:MAG: S41 family peptidase, partial [Planctomycetota bacterium]
MRRGWSRALRAALSALVLLPAISGAALAAQPTVARTVPENGASDVDPGLRRIAVTFDQEMSTGGYSWCGSGPTYPKTTGPPRWVNSRTCVLPVRLEPNHHYRLSINSPSFKNFRSARGEPAVPYPLSFRTGTGGPAKAAGQLTVKDNAVALEELRRAIDEDYSYRDLRGLDWDRLFDQHKPKLLLAKSPAAFAAGAGAMLAEARDVHVWLRVGEASFPSFRREAEPNYNLETLSRLVPDWQEPSPTVRTGRFADGIGYVMIASWSAEGPFELEPLYEALDDFADAPGLIVDVRPNSGGDERLARHFAGCFVEDP